MAKKFITSINLNGTLTSTGDISAGGVLKSTQSLTNEGGEIQLSAPSSGSTLSGPIIIDIYQNKLRFFENGGTARGYYIDLTTGGAGAGTNLVGSGSGTVTSITAGTGLSGGTITTTGTLSIDTAVVPQLSAANAFTVGGHIVNNASTTTVPLILKAVASQTVNQFEVWDTAAAKGFVVGPGGRTQVRNGGTDYGAALSLATAGTGVVGVIIRGVASQTANLQEWQTSAGGVLAGVSAAGFGFFGLTGASAGMVSIQPASTSTVGLMVRGVASQTADLFQVQNSAATALFKLSNLGTVQASIGTYSNTGPTLSLGDTGYGFSSEGAYLRHWTASAAGGGHLWYAGPNNTSPTRMFLNNSGLLALKGIASQTANLIELQNDSGTVLSGFNPAAQMFVGSTAPIYMPVGGATTAATGDGTTATITTTAAHGLAVGDMITVAGITPTGYNGVFRVTAVPTTTQVSYLNTTTGAQTVAGSVSAAAQASVVMRSAATAGLILRMAGGIGTGISPLAVQSSSGGNVAYINNYGGFYGAGLGPVNQTGGYITTNGSATVLVQTNVTTVVPMTIKAMASQTANLQEWQDSAGSALTLVDSTGAIKTGASIRATGGGLFGTTTAFSANLSVAATVSTQIGAVIRGAASQSANLTEWQNSAGTVLAKMASDGQIFATNLSTINSRGRIIEYSNGAYIQLLKSTVTANPGANILNLAVRDGTTAGTLKLVVRAGTAGTETPLIDNIDQTGTNTSLLAVAFIDGGSA